MNTVIPPTAGKRIVVIGGGFAGINFVKEMRYTPYQIVMIDRHNYHTFQPLLYQVATAGLEPDSISYPLRRTLSISEDFIFRVADVKNIVPEKNYIETTLGDIEYDYLVICTGSKTNYFGNKRLEKNTWPMKSVPEALNLRSMIIQNFEDALVADAETRKALMHYVIVGGGPTGVELAGALAELKKNAFRSDYPELDLAEMQIWLAEADNRVLAAMSPQASQKAREYLEKMGVKVMLGTKIEDYDGENLVYNSGQTVKASTVIWAAGVAGNFLSGLHADAVNRGGRIRVDAYNTVVGYDNIFALGDVACMESEELPRGHPMLAQVAIQQALNLAENLDRDSDMKTPFRYKDLGSMATVGKNRAVVDLPHIKFQGVFAWFVWMFVHLLALVGFRNKFITFVNWVYSYMKFDKGIRLIIRPVQRRREESIVPPTPSPSQSNLS
ncbi:MAG: NAD(P)/FAD-dependent oxidoreductase [Bacteroidia bacterium]|nr:NAD(P)/FAD-dependent oxidoreductase [Bacteroidia bacterium]